MKDTYDPLRTYDTQVNWATAPGISSLWREILAALLKPFRHPRPVAPISESKSTHPPTT